MICLNLRERNQKGEAMQNYSLYDVLKIELFEKALKEGYKPRLHFCHISKKDSIDL